MRGYGGNTMAQSSRTDPAASSALLYGISSIFIFLVLVGGMYFTLVKFGGLVTRIPTANAAEVKHHVHLNMSIVINQAGLREDWPAYSPSTLVAPAYSLVTVTLRNYDLGATPVPSGFPFTKVQSIVGGVAYMDGKAYTSVAPEKLAHTFTIPQLNINVPIPGDTTTGKPYVEVTFTFRTGGVGSYYFRCFDPCGVGSIGWEGPMMTKGYMLGTLTVVH
jgi:hypothetical protein